MPIWAQAGLWGLLGASSLVIGAMLAYVVRLPQRVTAGIMAFGCGVLISAVAYRSARRWFPGGRDLADHCWGNRRLARLYDRGLGRVRATAHGSGNARAINSRTRPKGEALPSPSARSWTVSLNPWCSALAFSEARASAWPCSRLFSF